jgi:hypothetical protein
VPRPNAPPPKGWAGRWDVTAFLSKRYAFFDAQAGLRRFLLFNKSEKTSAKPKLFTRGIVRRAGGELPWRRGDDVTRARLPRLRSLAALAPLAERTL